MSGTASRFQGRFGYAPGLQVGQYPAAPAPAMALPDVGYVSPVRASPLAMLAAPQMAAPQMAAAPVMAGSIAPERAWQGADGAGTSAQGDYGGVGPSGIGSTGSVLGDMAGFGREAGQAVAGLASGPMGPVGFGLGTLASGFAAALGYPETAADIARSIGLPEVAPIGYDPNAVSDGPGATVGAPVGIGAFGTPGLGEAPPGGYGTAGVSVKGGTFGASADGAGVGAESPDNNNSNSTAAGQDASGGNDGTGAGGPGTGAGAPGNDTGDWMRGGYTGAGPDGAVQPHQIAGRVHEGEVVIPAGQVQRYGLDPLLMLARGQVSPSRLSALLTR